MTDIVPGKLIQLSPLVSRITAPNPGPMTGPGTNCYLVGNNEIAVIDPGPAIPSHIESILQAGAGRIKWILATHTHSDHSPAAKVIAEATDAVVMGNLLPIDDGRQDSSFAPQHCFTHDETLSTDVFTLRALLTPGHVGNHVCYLLEEEGMLLTGDHIMQGSTVVIIPPHGDMSDYLESLKLLDNYHIQSIGPGHGQVIETPREEIAGLIEHRLGRETKVIRIMRDVKQGSLESLTPLVYDDVAASLYPIAQFSLWAHLIKLEKDGIVESENKEWLYKN